MADKKIVKQTGTHVYYDDKSKETINEYRKRMGKAPLLTTKEKQAIHDHKIKGTKDAQSTPAAPLKKL